MNRILDQLIGALCQRHIHISNHVLCQASVTDSGPALNQHWVFDMDNRTFQLLHIKIELTVLIPSNTERRRNDVLMF